MTRKKQQQKKKSKTQKKHAKSHVVPHHQKPLNKKTPPKSETAAEQIETNTFEQIEARNELLPPACIGIVEPDEAQTFSGSNQNDATLVTDALQAEVEGTGQAEELPESSAISLEPPFPTLSAEEQAPQPSCLVYDRDFLLRFQPLCKERLPTMPSLETIYGSTKSFQPKPQRFIKPKPYHDHGENKPEKTMPGNRFEDWRAKKAPEADKEDDSSLPTAWKPSRRRSQQSDTEAILHEVNGTLNKLTETNFAELSVAVRDSIQSPELQSGVVDLIFAKALQEPGFASLYARLCRFLDTSYRKSSPAAPGTITTFKTVLLNKCQQNFEEREKREEATTEEATEKERRKTIGNVVFIGELYKETLLPDIVMHICIKTLLGISNIQEKKMVKKAGERLTADLEALCVLLSTIGPVFDRKGTDEESYFGLMKQMSSNTNIPSRIRCKLLDVLELRARHWKPKRR